MVTLFLKHHSQESDVFSPEVTHCLNGPVEGVEDVAPENVKRARREIAEVPERLEMTG
jgi:hypothetical protein